MAQGGHNYVPRGDDDFDVWLSAFLLGAENWWLARGGDGPLDPLRELRDAWAAAHAASVAADAAARAATAAKNAARAVCEAELRAMVRQIQGTPDTTNADRAEMGIALRNPGPGTATGLPRSRPVGQVEIPARLTHRLRIADKQAGPGESGVRTARPRGTLGAEVFLALTSAGTEPPRDPAAYQYITLATRGVLSQRFAPGDGGRTAHYQFRWLGSRGQPGPWSEVVSATIAA